MGKFTQITLKPEPKTHYVDYKPGGSKHCFNCHHFEKEKSECNGPYMIELTEKKILPDGNVKVHPVGLCKFWEPKEKK